MNKNLLIIFYRNPELGKVKTRLAATLGDATALAIYLKLVSHTRSITENLKLHKAVYYSHFIDREDNWPAEMYDKQIQEGDTLGEKLEHAVKNGFERGFESICVIGSDCFELTEEILKDAFKSLESRDAVIGPARDGGYYLLGIRKFVPLLFQNKNWSTASVASDTINDFERLDLTYTKLPLLTDVDTESDLPSEILSKLKQDDKSLLL